MEEKKLEVIRHSCSHLLAAAVMQLWPDTKLAIGPAIKDGFYYDFDFLKPISETDFPKIEEKMAEIKARNLPFVKKDISVQQAKKLFVNQHYKKELIKELALEEGVSLSIYTMGSFVDLCAGPHLKNTKDIGVFKLLSVAGAYWKGDEKNKMLTRIYGTAFLTKKELDEYLAMIEEAKKRDHRKIGKEQDLFSFHPEGQADVFWHHKGYLIMKELFSYWREIHEREGYLEVRTPEILTKAVWKQSGHLDNFLPKMYRVLTPEAKEWDMAIKPMNCDGGILIYKTKQRSYRDFPLKMGELGVVHRFEASGEVTGIIRPREFTQDDAHIYCTPEQVKDELKKVIELCFELYDTFGLKLDHLELSTRPENSIGSDEVWIKAESIMREVLKEKNVPHQINEGEGAFYGPKFDFHLKDSLGRTWQCSTIQLDFALPEKFDLEYTTKNGSKERPVMIHRVLYGSVERFLGIFIEHCAGAFPVWLSPVQVKVIPVSEKSYEYGRKVREKLLAEKVRVELDDRNETVPAKIRDAEKEKIPYMLIVGPKEEQVREVNVRVRGEKNLGNMSLEQLLALVKEDIAKKRQV